jgi:hypothetical protein
MKTHFTLIIIVSTIFYFLIPVNGLAQQNSVAQDTTFIEDNNEPIEADEEFNIFLGLIGIIGIFAMVTCIGIGLGICLLVSAIIALFIGLGILSISALYGHLNTSITKGFKLFTILSCILVSIFGSTCIIYLIKKIMHLDITFLYVFITSLFTAIVSGLIIGVTINFITINTARFIQQKLNIKV